MNGVGRVELGPCAGGLPAERPGEDRKPQGVGHDGGMGVVRGFGHCERIGKAPHNRIGEFFRRKRPFALGRRPRKKFCGEPEARPANGGTFDVCRMLDRQGHVQMDEGQH
ncbi:hypothetical protein ACVWWP_004983 [Bradyrhizobium sp. LM3.6]